MKVCSTTSCPTLVAKGRCPKCIADSEARRGTASQRGYTSAGHQRFRTAVLRRNPLCVCEDVGHGHGRPCTAPSTVADHHPLSRRELIEQKLNPNSPSAGRGICKRCHDKATAQHQPGGWASR